MSFINIEIKARTAKTAEIRQYLFDNKAEFIGTDEQTDTYYHVPNGRLKLRQGRIENNLIYYDRVDQEGPKQSNFDLVRVEDGKTLHQILEKALGVRIKVKKTREIYFIGNVKIHLDTLDGLGNFVEIEASNRKHDIEVEKLREQCNFYMNAFGIDKDELINVSYSDMIEMNTP